MSDGGERVEPRPIRTGWLLPTTGPANGRVAVGIEVLPEHHMVGQHQPIQPSVVGRPGELDELGPIAGVFGSKGSEVGRQLRSHGEGAYLPSSSRSAEVVPGSVWVPATCRMPAAQA